ncbi:hypothetical protein V6N13_024040 [Hibiscus sabdariffa]|uniref:Uncharacterized protein n=2 Tax=Hibiscus sabdariffa TaxID=183260 RepID=A0ABR2BWA0_9ROSI
MPTGDPMGLAEEPTIPSQSTVLAPSSPHESNQAVNDQIVELVQAEPHISPPTDSVAPEEVDAVVAAETNTPSLAMVNDEPAISLPCSNNLMQPRKSVANTHPMQTRGKAGIRKPKIYSALLELIPSTVSDALQHD